MPRHLRTEALMQARARSGDPPTMALALAMDMTDPYLTNWKKDAANPIAFTGQGLGSEFGRGNDRFPPPDTKYERMLALRFVFLN